LLKRTTDGYPLTDVYRDENDNQVIEMALAGFSKKDLEIKVKDNTITIGHQSSASGNNGRRIARRSFTKTFVDYNNTLNLAKSKANFENGLLVITIPQLEDKKALSIEIK
jgi:molecular chaperone IbpA